MENSLVFKVIEWGFHDETTSSFKVDINYRVLFEIHSGK